MYRAINKALLPIPDTAATGYFHGSHIPMMSLNSIYLSAKSIESSCNYKFKYILIGDLYFIGITITIVLFLKKISVAPYPERAMVVIMVHYALLSLRPQSIILVSNTLIASSTQKILFIMMLIPNDSDQIRMNRIDLSQVGVSLNLPSYWLFMTLLSSTSSWWIFHMMLHNKTSTCLSPLAAFSYAQSDQCDHSSYTETSEIKLCVHLCVCIC